jgi:EAL domain-containing protein (putative c-di-GMP-specific phosphodiesterase class I)
VEQREFKVYYQPKYNIQYEPPRLASAEALVRWQHPELGLIPPCDFIPLFEGNGQISIIDKYVWAEAARQIALWKEKYGVTVPVSVNLSRVDVFDPQLEDILDGLIFDNGLIHQDLKLEVTESAYTENAEEVLKVIERLRTKGYEIEMDDFGSGYSSLNMLSSMPVDVLKMDRGFIMNIEHSEQDFRLVQLILDIARNLKLPVIAEGVETEEQIWMLKNAGCDYVQGYYFSRPLPAEEFEKLIMKEIEASKERLS